MIIRVKKEPAKHEKGAIYAVNQRISNVGEDTVKE